MTKGTLAMDTFAWDWRKEHAAQLVADGTLTLIAIAAEIGVSVVTLRAWRKHPEFAARVEEHLDVLRDEVRRRGIAVRELRVRALNDRWERMQAIVEARAGDPKLADAPGGKTGLIARDIKAAGKGQTVDVFSVDTGLLHELREHEKQAAQELGQWIERRAVEQTTKAYVTVGPDEL